VHGSSYRAARGEERSATSQRTRAVQLADTGPGQPFGTCPRAEHALDRGRAVQLSLPRGLERGHEPVVDVPERAQLDHLLQGSRSSTRQDGGHEQPHASRLVLQAGRCR
jgi:hypothetical protein